MPQKETGCHDSKEEEGNHHSRVPTGKVMFLHQERKVERHDQYNISGKPIEKHQFSADDGKGFRVSAHEVTGAWSQRTLTWNNQPSFKTEALDYLTLENTNKMAVPKTFDVTKLIRGWYNNPSSNHGIALKAVNENVYATATLVSSDMPVNKYGLTADCYPIGIVYYRSTRVLRITIVIMSRS